MQRKPLYVIAITTLVLVLAVVVYAQIPQLQIQPPKLLELPEIVHPGEQFTLDVGEELESFWIQVIRGGENRISIIGPLGIDPDDYFIDTSDYFIMIEGIPGESLTINFEEGGTSILFQPRDPLNLDISQILHDDKFSSMVDELEVD